MPRYAIVRDRADRVEPYLPAHYRVAAVRDRETLIEGEDYCDWTLDGYVIPRLASGLIFAEEITPEQALTFEGTN